MLAVGDSVTTGFACNCIAFPQAYAALISKVRGVPTTANNLGVNGQTSSELLAQVSDPSSPIAQQLPQADIDLITIGANDFADHEEAVTTGQCQGADGTGCVDAEMTTLAANVTTLLTDIHRSRGDRPTAVLVTGYWNVFQDGTVAHSAYSTAGVAASKALTLRTNTVLRQVALASGATYVGLYAAFNGPAAGGDVTDLLTPDGDHPNAQGHLLIAQRLVAAGLPGLVRG